MAAPRLMLCAVVVCILLRDASAIASPPIGRTIAFQAHSYDDMREWIQLFNKGTRYLKLDPHYMPASFCATQTGVLNASDPRGCMVLSHDNPVASRTGYNTTDQIPVVLADPAYRKYFTLDTTFYVALCFKSAPDLCDASSPSFNSWLSLVDELVANVNEAVASNGLNVRFFLDGDGVPVNCLAHRWEPWVATYISFSDPAAAFYSNNASLAYNRFAILNEPQELFPLAADLKYGKFTNATETWLIWEPSDQPTIDSLCETYVSKGIEHEPGLRFAINIDPAQFQVYSAPQTGKAWSLNITNGTSPSVVFVPTPAGGHVMVVVSTTATGTLQYTTGSVLTVLGNVSITVPSRSVPSQHKFIGSVKMSTAQRATSSVILLADGATASAHLFDPSTQVLGPPNTTVSVPGGTVGDTMSLVQGPPAETLYAVAVTSKGLAGCNLSAQLLTIDLQKSSISRVGQAACVQVGVSAMNVSASFVATAGGTVRGAIVYATADHKVYGATLCGNLATGDFLVNEPCRALATKGPGRKMSNTVPRQFHVGTSPSVGVVVDATGTPFVVEAHANGFCPNSETHNKQPTPGVCRQTPVTTAHILNYVIAPLDAFEDLVNSGQLASACSHTILHGAFSQGGNPQVATYSSTSAVPDPASIPVLFPPSLGFAVVHDALPDETDDPSGCGAPITGSGSLLDSWQAQYSFTGP